MNKIIPALALIFSIALLEQALPAQSQVETGFVKVDDGKLYYQSAGKGQTVVLIHGFTLDRRMWDFEFEALAKSFRVIRYDLRGHGKSSGVSKPFNHVSDLAALLDKLSVTKMQLIGLSLGGEIACDFSIAYPERVQTAILIDPYYRLPDSYPVEAADARILGHISLARQQGLEAGLASWLNDPLFGPACEDEALKAKLEEMVIDGHGSLGDGAMFINSGKREEFERLENKAPADIRCPVLCLVGQRDLPRFHAIADYFSKTIPDIDVVTVPDAGHMANMEKPEFLVERINGFLKR